MDAVVALISDIKGAGGAGTSDGDLAAARGQHRKAQFYLDFIEAENSMGFHADQESMRILALSLDAARLGQVVLRDPNVLLPPAAADRVEGQTPGG
jgi:nitrite reductase (cytochrome c-552)